MDAKRMNEETWKKYEQRMRSCFGNWVTVTDQEVAVDFDQDMPVCIKGQHDEEPVIYLRLSPEELRRLNSSITTARAQGLPGMYGIHAKIVRALEYTLSEEQDFQIKPDREQTTSQE